MGSVRDLFSEAPEFLGRIVTKRRPLEGSTRPSDLLAFPSPAQRWPIAYADHAEFLMVAYGCSLPRDAVPEMSLPYDQRPVAITRPMRHTPSYEDLGFG